MAWTNGLERVRDIATKVGARARLVEVIFRMATVKGEVLMRQVSFSVDEWQSPA